MCPFVKDRSCLFDTFFNDMLAKLKIRKSTIIRLHARRIANGAPAAASGRLAHHRQVQGTRMPVANGLFPRRSLVDSIQRQMKAIHPELFADYLRVIKERKIKPR